MSIAPGVSSKGATSANTVQATTGVTTQVSGSAFLVGFAWNAAATFTSLVDSKSNIYTQIGSEVLYGASAFRTRLYYKENGVGGASHTATVTVSGSTVAITILFVEVTAGTLSGILDQQNSRNDAASPFTLAAGLTTTQANELLVSFLFGNSGANPATHAETGLGSSTIQTGAEETNGASFFTGAVATSVKSATGTFNPSWTEGSGTDSAVYLVTLKEAASAVAAPVIMGQSCL